MSLKFELCVCVCETKTYETSLFALKSKEDEVIDFFRLHHLSLKYKEHKCNHAYLSPSHMFEESILFVLW